MTAMPITADRIAEVLFGVLVGCVRWCVGGNSGVT